VPKLPPETHSARRTHILDAAERCFVRSGFHRATMNEICKEAGVSPGAFYIYFASKEELIAGLCERECATFAEMLAENTKAGDLVEAITGLAGQCPIFQSPEKLKLHADIATEATRNAAVAEVTRSSDAFVIQRFEEFLTAARDAGRINPCCDIPMIAQTLLLIGDGLFLYCARNPDFESHSIRPTLDVIVRALLNPAAAEAHGAQPENLSQKVKKMKDRTSCALLGGLLIANVALAAAPAAAQPAAPPSGSAPAPSAQAAQNQVVTVTPAHYASFTDSVMVTGSLAPREEVLVGPEIDGLRIVELLAQEGDEVQKGQVLARLSKDLIEAQLAQNSAKLVRANASIEQARLMITETEALATQAAADFDRANKLRRTGVSSIATFDQRQAAARTSKVKVASAKRGLTLAEAEKAQLEAQRQELTIKLEQTEIKAPADGLISRRAARLGAQASSAGDPLFRIIAKGEIELDGEVAEAHLPKLAQGMPADVSISGLGERTGRIRLIMPEVEKSTRLGRVRIFLGADPALHIGGFARAVIETSSVKGLAVPAGAVLYGPEGPAVQVVKKDRVETRLVRTGLAAGDAVEIRSGLTEGEMVVARAGAFLRDGDAVRPVLQGQTTLSEQPGETVSQQR
jgi:HlyD family secretion protein